MTTRKGLATAGVAILTIGVAVLTVPLATIQSLNVVSAVGGAVVVAGLIVLAMALFRSADPTAPSPPAEQRRQELRTEIRGLKDELIDADAALKRNEIDRRRSASVSGDGAAHLYDSIETRLIAAREKIAARLSDVEQDLEELDAT